jgi:hypothetical protein
MIRYRGFFSTVSLLLGSCLVALTCPPPLCAQDSVTAQDSAPPFRIMVLEGEGAVNNIHEVVNRAVSVEVDDVNHNPLSGVSVTFFLPNDGPSGLFPNGSRVLTVFTDNKGVAVSRSIRFNNQVGLMKIDVVATLFSQNVSHSIMQTNVGSPASVKSSYVPAAGGSTQASRPHSKKWIVIAIVAAAVAGGAAYYLTTRNSTPTAPLSTGSPTVGTPAYIGIR